MNLKEMKHRLADAVETENPPGTTYYGAELDESEVEAVRERMDHSIRVHEEALGEGDKRRTPLTNPRTP
ncbi:MAG: hypothetical protein ACJ746_07595 [Bryobacteraceae bacterium]